MYEFTCSFFSSSKIDARLCVWIAILWPNSMSFGSKCRIYGVRVLWDNAKRRLGRYLTNIFDLVSFSKSDVNR